MLNPPGGVKGVPVESNVLAKAPVKVVPLANKIFY